MILEKFAGRSACRGTGRFVGRAAVLALVLAGCSHQDAARTATTTTKAPERAVEAPETAANDKEVVRLLTIAYVVLSATTTTTTRATPAPTSSSGSSRPGNFLECVRERESGGDYTAVSPGGDWRGAYQFAPDTWNSTADHAGRPDLAGVDPASASAADQDAMAQHLLGWQGTGPWAGGNYPC